MEGGRDCLKSQTFLSENQEFALARYREMNKFNLEWTFETAWREFPPQQLIQK